MENSDELCDFSFIQYGFRRTFGLDFGRNISSIGFSDSRNSLLNTLVLLWLNGCCLLVPQVLFMEEFAMVLALDMSG